jgi:HAD superfamily hydrolase (TIGR01509 family)
MSPCLFDAVIFDFDGVLVDSEPRYLAATNAVFAREGRVLDALTAAKYSGLRYPEMLAELIPLLGLSRDVDYYIRESRIEEARVFGGQLEAVAGAATLMSQLAQRSMPCAVGSSSNHAWVDRVLHRLGLREYVSVVVGGDEVTAGKPHPEVFLRCAELLGVAPSRCAVIEDSVNGVLAACAAGMSPIGFPTYSGASLHLYECFAIVSSLEEVADVLKLIQAGGPDANG